MPAYAISQTVFVAVLLLLCCLSTRLVAQSAPSVGRDGKISPPIPGAVGLSDTAYQSSLDSTENQIKSLIYSWWKQKKNALRKMTGTPRTGFPAKIPDSLARISAKKFLSTVNTEKNISNASPWIGWKGGYVQYDYHYRSNLDTPYAQHNLSQHQIIASGNFQIARVVPISATALIRRSNSPYFRDITDVQLSFNPAAYRQQIAGKMQAAVQSISGSLRDSLAGHLYNAAQSPLEQLRQFIRSAATRQTLFEAKEILADPQKSYEIGLPDSVNQKRADSAQALAKKFIAFYEETAGRYRSLQNQVDSLKEAYDKSVREARSFEQTARAGLANSSTTNQWIGRIESRAAQNTGISTLEKWLSDVRKLSAGRSALSGSELTAKNIDVTGLNFEYSGRYYLAVAAGLVDYRFRDFLIKQSRTPQYLYLLRAGLGRPESSHLFLSVFHGRKQLFATTGTGTTPTSISASGLTIETKWQYGPWINVTAEAGQSFAPDHRYNPAKTVYQINFRETGNKAFALGVQGRLPKLGFSIEGRYRFTGQDYQCFNVVQPNAQWKSWSVKADQSLVHNAVRLSVAVRTSEYSNPLIQQNYKANMAFVTASATLNFRNLPKLTIAYLPMSQFTTVDGKLYENRFQTWNATVTHFYRLGERKAITSFLYSRFFNSSADSGFIYYNAVNLMATQTIFFTGFSSTTAVTLSNSPFYRYSVLEQSFAVPVKNQATISGGIKLNFLESMETHTGGFLSLRLAFRRSTVLAVRFEKTYLPAPKNHLLPTTFGNVTLTKSI